MNNSKIEDLCDALLERLNNTDFQDVDHWNNQISKEYVRRDFTTANELLYFEQFIQLISYSDEIKITAKGKIFLAEGGYKNRREMLTKASAESKLLFESTLNLNEATQKIYGFQKIFTFVTTGVSIVALIISYWAYKKDDSDPLLRTMIEQQNKKFDSMMKVQQQIERHPSRITTDTLHFTNQPSSGVVDKNLREASR